MSVPVETNRERLLRLLRERAAVPAAMPAAAPAPTLSQPMRRSDRVPLSLAQEPIWIQDQLRPGGHNIVLGQFELLGTLDATALQHSLTAIVARHEILRTTFPVVDGVPEQRIAPSGPVELPLLDLSSVPAADRDAAMRAVVAEHCAKSYELESGPLLGCLLLRTASDRHLLIVAIHHMLADGWSFMILHRELAQSYARARGRGAADPVPLPMQYADFAEWQRQVMHSARLQPAMAYWKRQLAGSVAALDLPFDRKPAGRFVAGGLYALTLDPALQSALRDFSRQQGVTLHTALLTALNILLLRYTGQDDIVVGTIIADRPTAATEQMIGLFLNTLVLRTSLTGDPDVRTALQRTRDVVLQAHEHAEVPFYALVNEVRPERDPDRSPLFHGPLFDVMFNMQSFEAESALEAAELRIARVSAADYYKTADTLSVYAYDWRDRIEVHFGYNRALFDAATAECFCKRFIALMGDMVRRPECRLSKLTMLDDAERESVLSMTQGAPTTVPLESGFGGEFVERVRRTPGAMAARDADGSLSYEQLQAAALQVADLLRRDPPAAGEPIGICAPPGVTLLAGLLGCFEAGAAYLPLDVRYPIARHMAMLQRSRVGRVLVTDDTRAAMQAALSGLPSEQRPQLLALPPASASVSAATATRANMPTRRAAPDQLAYVLFTSGSTGTPKGAMVSHGAMLNHLCAKRRLLELGVADRVLQSAPIGFDVSIWQMLAPLLAGASVHFASSEVAADPTRLFHQIVADEITIAQLVPSFLRAFLDAVDRGLLPAPELRQLRLLLLVGESLPPELVRRWLTRWPHVPLVNGYGPSECADEASRQLLERVPGDAARIAIGRPIDNVRLYVLDGAGGLLPTGAAGELCIGGAAVGLGYLNDAERTAAHFHADPFGAPGGRYYRTGDRGRLRSDGRFEILGRLDLQLKIRGQRVEPGEIEALLEEHEAVAQAAVHAWSMPQGTRLVAYLVARDPQQPPDPSLLREYLVLLLPGYMVPDQFIVLPSLPLNANGKIDRRALPAPAAAPKPVFVAPRSTLERLVARVWSRQLETDRRIGAHDSFFDLGGHSLLAAQVAAQLRQELQLDVPLRVLFEQRTLAQLAAHLESAQQAEQSREQVEL